MSEVKRPKKARNRQVTHDFLKQRTEYCAALGFAKPKWIYFCETMISKGFGCRLYEAKKTVSKYIMVHKNGIYYKVRFSNHKPIAEKESAKDCDFFVGISNSKVTTTEDAIEAVLNNYTVKFHEKHIIKEVSYG